LTIEAGERLVVAGKNGAGKTTLLRIIAGTDKGFQGTVSYGTGIAAGYFSQDSAEELNGSEAVLAFMESAAPTTLIPKVRDMLGAFLFRGDDVYKPLSVLSGGEKSRLALLRLLLRPVNLLILDEPTNHLDIHSKDVLLEALRKFAGTVIFVSHDRSFMEALSTKTLELRPPKDGQNNGPSSARLFYGDYGYYLERLEAEAASMTAQFASPTKASIPPHTGVNGSSASQSTEGQSRKQRELTKQRQALIRRLEREEGEILATLEMLEREKAALEAELAKPDVYSSGEKAKAVKLQLDGVAAELEVKAAGWEAKAAELGKVRTLVFNSIGH
jgi:ATP-binding cassette subfamily F protein 3